ncbi:MAG: TRAP transporter fused permease subunit [Pseudomonadota bacterium]
MKYVISGLCVLLSVFHFYTAGFGAFGVMIQRAFPLMMAMVIIFLWIPLGAGKGAKQKNIFCLLIDILLIAGSIFSCGYLMIYFHEIAARMGITTTEDVVAGVVGLICLLEATRRATGNALVGIALVAIVYIFVGPYLPGILNHEGFNLARMARVQWTGLVGVFGTIMGVMVTVIYIFILFASFLRASKAGADIIELALSVTGRFTGGPALSAVMVSMLFGSVSGSPVANVVGTGTFTIPLMKKYGFAPHIAGCVEAAASSGGYIMPPIMGAAAFIMAEFLGIPYIKIALIAFLPSFIYFGSLFLGVYIYSLKIGVQKMRPEDLPKMGSVLKKGMHIFITLPLLIVMLVMGYTPAKACFYTLVALFVMCFFRRETRMDMKKIYLALEDGAFKSVGIMVACASMGIIIGTMDLTGFGTSLGYYIELYAGKMLLLCLFLTMLASILMGMGVAPVATYIILVVMLGPVLNKLGLSLFNAHFFILYFSTYAVLTPPVALAAYAGAGIAGADPFKTGIEGFKLGLPGFVLPFIFAYYPAFLMEKGWMEAAGVFLLAVVMLFPLNFANFGYFLTDMNNRNRLLLVAASVMLWFLKFYWIVALLGLLILVFVLADQYTRYKKEAASGGRRAFAPAVAAAGTGGVAQAEVSEEIKKLEDVFRD